MDKLINEFKELTKKVIAAEKEGFWSDWTEEQRELYTSGDWKAFSESRGYSEEEIYQFKEWLRVIDYLKLNGVDALAQIEYLTTEAAMKNITKDNNNEIVKSSHIPSISKEKMRAGILDVEERMKTLPNVMKGDCFPLKHTFGDGCYVREISVPKGHFVVTKIHKVDHPCFILKGDCSILTENGPIRVKAPYHCITLAGTKRIVYVHEDTIWVTVHVTKERDLKKIEEQVIAKTFEEVDIPKEIKLQLINKEEVESCLG